MIEITAIQSAIASVNAALEFVNRLREISADRATTDLVSKMLSEILDAKQHTIVAQSEHHRMADRVRELEGELREIKDFRKELEGYELQRFGNTAFAYVPRSSEEGGEMRHWLCAACCQNDRKSVLQWRRRGLVPHSDLGKNIWGCPACNAEIVVPGGCEP